MDAALVDEIATACTIAHAGMRAGLRAHAQLMPVEVHAAFVAYKGDFVAAVSPGTEGQRAGKLRDLLRYLNEQIVAASDTALQRAVALVRWNKLFNLSVCKLVDLTIVNAATAYTIVTEIYSTGQSVSPAFRAYCGATANAHHAVYTMRQRFIDAGLGFAPLYNVIHFFHQNLFNFARLNVDSAVEIYRLALALPPRSGFAGFADWGPGNHGDIELNKTNHFFKHVLDADPAELAWKDETRIWWLALNVALTRNIARANLPVVQFNAVTAQFPADDDTALAGGNVVAFLALMRAQGAWAGQPIRDWFSNAYRAAYVAHVLASGRHLTSASVHTTPGGGLFVSGRQGSFFVVGRNHNHVLGVSSGYVAENINDKLAARVDIWPLDP